MEIELVRWYNARLLQILSGKTTYTSLARFLHKDVALVQKWFNRRQIIKPIGNDAAREIETLLKHYIVLETGENVRNGWLDTPHYDLWTRYINVTVSDSEIKYYPVESIYGTTIDILDRIHNNKLELSSSDIAALIVQYLPLWSPNEKAKNTATDTIMVEALKIKREKLNQNNRDNVVNLTSVENTKNPK